MTVSTDTRRRWALITAIRGALMLLGGLYAIFFPAAALTALVIVGGALLLIDGVLGLWSLTFGGAKTGNFWFDVVRNALAIIVGVLVLVSPLIATLLTATFLMTLIALQAIVVGAMEIYIVVKERALYAHIWPVLLSGVIYVLFGLLVLVFPPAAAGVLVVVAGFLMVFYAVGLFGLAWRVNKRA